MLKAGVSTWEALKWRPLASYFLHRWSKLFRLAAKWCNFVTYTFREGFAISNPRYMVGRVLMFKEKFRADPGGGSQSTSLEQSLYNIKQFSTWAPRGELRTAVEYYVRLISHKSGKLFQWSRVDKQPAVAYDPVLHSFAASPKGWRPFNPANRRRSYISRTRVRSAD